jgi:hypothetical protein
MLFNDDLLFLHAPKTAGTSVTSFFIANLPRVTLTEPSDGPGRATGMTRGARLKLALRRLRRHAGMLVRPQVTVIKGSRHETLAEAAAILQKQGRSLESFRAIVAIVRNPYDLEVSRYHFFRRGYHGIPGAAHELAEVLAQAGDFAEFALKAPYHGRLPSRIEDWYEIDGHMPANLHTLRFENLEADLYALVAQFHPIRTKLPRLNATEHASYTSYLTPATEEAIYRKYRWLFDKGLYARAYSSKP